MRAAGMVFVSGQVGLMPGTKEMAGPGAAEQAEQALANLAAIVRASGSSLDRVLKTTLYLVDMEDFASVNEVYARHFGGTRPARATVAVSALPLGARVEIDAVALAGDG